jgi:hypothetical protein
MILGRAGVQLDQQGRDDTNCRIVKRNRNQ